MAADDLYRVLRPDITREAFAKAATAVGLTKHSTLEGDGHKVAYEEIWTTPDQKNAVRFVEDPLSGTKFLRGQGPRRASYVRELQTKMKTYPPEEIIEQAQDAKNHDDQVQAIFRVAVTFPKFDPAAFEVFRVYAICAKNPMLRRATFNAMAYRGWSEFIPLMEEAASKDPDEEVRKTAQRLLPHLLEYRDKQKP
jgi:hypothetical protein